MKCYRWQKSKDRNRIVSLHNGLMSATELEMTLKRFATTWEKGSMFQNLWNEEIPSILDGIIVGHVALAGGSSLFYQNVLAETKETKNNEHVMKKIVR